MIIQTITKILKTVTEPGTRTVKPRPHLQHFPSNKHEQTEQTVQTQKTLSIKDG